MLAGTSLASTSLGTPPGNAEPDSRKLESDRRGHLQFRFIQINDIHYQSPSADIIHPTYLGANARFHWLLEVLAEGAFFPEIDFILLLGDCVHQHSEDLERELRNFKTLLDRTGIPFYPVVGNHENRQGEGIPEKEAPFVRVFGEDRFHYRFLHKGVGFVIADNSGTSMASLTPEALQRREARFSKHLAEYAGYPTLVACHIPLVPLREQSVLEHTFGFSSYFTREPGLLDIVNRQTRPPAAVLSGHLHLSGSVLKEKTRHLVASGPASFPHDILLHSIYDHGLLSEMIRLPSNYLEPSTNIHGAHRFGRDFIDKDHPSYTTYLMGTPEERSTWTPWK